MLNSNLPPPLPPAKVSPVQQLLAGIENELSQKPRQDLAAINQLPDEVLVKILARCLDKHQDDTNNSIFSTVRLTCKKLFLLCQDREIWKNYVATNKYYLKSGSRAETLIFKLRNGIIPSEDESPIDRHS